MGAPDWWSCLKDKRIRRKAPVTEENNKHHENVLHINVSREFFSGTVECFVQKAFVLRHCSWGAKQSSCPSGEAPPIIPCEHASPGFQMCDSGKRKWPEKSTWKDVPPHWLEKRKSKLQRGITSHLSEWPWLTSQQTVNAEEGAEKREPTLLHCWWECKLIKPLWNIVWRFLQKLNIEWPYDPASHSWVCIQRKPLFKKIHAPLYSWQHYLQ